MRPKNAREIRRDAYCAVCGKLICLEAYDDYQYKAKVKVGGKLKQAYYCSWSCYRKASKK